MMIHLRVFCLRQGVSSIPRASLSTSVAVCDRSRQATGRAGMPSPYLRTPFFHERAPLPGVDLSLQERLDELYPKNPIKGDRVNIGFAAESNSR